MICYALGKGAVTHITCKNWYKRFHGGDFKDIKYPGQKFEDEELQHLLDQNSAQKEKKLYNSKLSNKPFRLYTNKFWTYKKARN